MSSKSPWTVYRSPGFNARKQSMISDKPFFATIPKVSTRTKLKMRLSQFIVALGFSSGVLAAPCRTGAAWYLEPNDCICMNSTDGAILEKQTATICAAMKYRTADNVRK